MTTTDLPEPEEFEVPDTVTELLTGIRPQIHLPEAPALPEAPEVAHPAASASEVAPGPEQAELEETKERRDALLWGGIGIVGIATAMLTWAGWVDLGHVAKIASVPTPWDTRIDFAWLLPLCVDVYALVSARVYLSLPWVSRETRAYARKSMLAAVVLSVLGVTAGHVLHGVEDALPPWALIAVRVITPAIAPAMLALTAHLAALVSRDWRERNDVLTNESSQLSDVPTDDVEPVPVRPSTPSRAVPVPQTKGTERRPSTRTGKPRKGRTGAADKTRTDDELLAVLENVPRDADGTVSVRRAAKELGCGPDRARRLLDRAGLRRTDDTEEN